MRASRPTDMPIEAPSGEDGLMVRSGSLRSMTSDVLPPQLAERVDEAKEYELQKRELVRLLRSAQGEERRGVLSQSLQELEANFQDPSAQQRRLSIGSMRSTSLDADESEDESIGMSPGSSRASTPRESSPYEPPRRFPVDPSSPLALWSSKPRAELDESSLTNSRKLAPVPEINLRRLSVEDSMERSSAGAKGVLPSSARPMSARRRNTKELRTIPENRPFVRPLSSKAKTGNRQTWPTLPSQGGAALSQRLSKHTLSASGRPLPSPERLAELVGREIDLLEEGILIDIGASSFDPLHPPEHVLSSGWPSSSTSSPSTAAASGVVSGAGGAPATPSSPSSQNSSSHASPATFWMSTGHFPQTLTVRFGCKVQLLRVNFDASGSPMVSLGGAFEDIPVGQQQLSVPDEFESSSGGLAGLQTFQVDLAGHEAADQGTTELCVVLKTALSPFCLVQGLRIIGRISASG
uniref:Uncharacterized protein n=1 Tax=Rhizochromulina marina TaxID=1034831 RepID=A0A7S2WMX4_9STRA|mmetsp:Transcript_28147/g.82402  ORF Transcript_28147/g.82402 Transcript_28147/m.82402 type:complete len:466 (+) Transcript_28147:144-1541(+)|eukprot:CAMPEP_0118986840 /NCGR_PEP_ID=MMETSP1173-20130426/42940_1 /TAXON_ID=1034831 /ORGANISM="Rhizochromulina marina cf, Strain CCMP1243" /LENGTH=465 /DNA_ID=CAMNT_0006937647 /DNA_START=114 /DNA_END=1511 /DNA_ORIENTATION=-